MQVRLNNVRITKRQTGAIGTSNKGNTVWFPLDDCQAFSDSLGTASVIIVECEDFSWDNDPQNLVFLRGLKSAHIAPPMRPGGSAPQQGVALSGLDTSALNREQATTDIALPRVAEFFCMARDRGASRVAFKFPDAKVRIHLAQNRVAAHVTDGRPYGDNTYYGKLDLATRMWKTSAPSEVIDFVVKFDTTPDLVASASGQLTGTCCFCGRGLETAESVSVGYGPICADNYGLPWGDQRASFKEEMSK